MAIRNRALSPEELRGTYTALITPMFPGTGRRNAIDYPKMFRLINDQFDSSVTGVVVAGTTGQSATLSPDEQVELITKTHEYIRRTFGQDFHFIAGSGSNSTDEAITLSERIEDAIGPTTLLHVTGYYNGPPQEGLYAHFTTIADALVQAGRKSNIILYNVPGRTKSEIEPETIYKLAESPRIIGIKQALGSDLTKVMEVIKNTDPNKFVTLSGEDDQVAEIMRLGGKGVISASANIAPRYFVRMTDSALEGDHMAARQIQADINPIVRAVFSAKNPIPLAHMFETELRLPLVKLPRIEEDIRQALSKYTPDSLGVDIRNYR
jgi:4-hydroxy-tetrahydrodipicolinate synthase